MTGTNARLYPSTVFLAHTSDRAWWVTANDTWRVARPGPSVHDLLESEALRPGSGIDLSSVSRIEATITVDAQRRTLAGMEFGPCWVVHGKLGGHVLSLVGIRSRDDIELVRISDIEPYGTGREHFIETLRRTLRPGPGPLRKPE